MTLRARRLLYLTCILIFAATAVPLVLYTAGWRYDWKYRRLVETGSLVVKSYPDKATILIDGQALAKPTPTIINNILPGKINLVVRKEGYHVWQKTVTITPRVTTFVENVKLFRESSPRVLVAGPVREYWWNKKQDKIAYLTDKGQLRLYNAATARDILLATSARRAITNVSWSPHNDDLLVSRGSEYFIVDAAYPDKIINLTLAMDRPLSALQWDQTTPYTIYGLSAGSLYRFPYLLKTTRLVLSGPIITYQIEPERIVFLKKNGSLAWINISDPGASHALALRSDVSHDKIVLTNSPLVAVQNSRERTLTVFNSLASDPIGAIEITNISKAIWSYDGRKLVYTDGNGIYERLFPTNWEPEKENKPSQLITRYAQPVTDIFWTDDENYIFYHVGNTLRVLALWPEGTLESLILVPEITAARQATFAARPGAVSFLDQAGALQILPLAVSGESAFFLGD